MVPACRRVPADHPAGQPSEDGLWAEPRVPSEAGGVGLTDHPHSGHAGALTAGTAHAAAGVSLDLAGGQSPK